MTPVRVVQPGFTYLIQTVHHWGERIKQTKTGTSSRLECWKECFCF